MPAITPQLVEGLREWLGPDGSEFFREVKEKYGTLLAVWQEGAVPHIVHFREGMQVRNKLRELTGGAWTAQQYDDLWARIVEQAIEENG